MVIVSGWGEAAESPADRGLRRAATTGKRRVIPRIPTMLRRATTMNVMDAEGWSESVYNNNDLISPSKCGECCQRIGIEGSGSHERNH